MSGSGFCLHYYCGQWLADLLKSKYILQFWPHDFVPIVLCPAEVYGWKALPVSWYHGTMLLGSGLMGSSHGAVKESWDLLSECHPSMGTM